MFPATRGQGDADGRHRRRGWSPPNLLQDWTGKRIVELEGPERVSQNQIAAELSKALGRPVRAQAVPREKLGRESFALRECAIRFRASRWLDGFNEGWISFEGGGKAALRKGRVSLAEVLQKLVG